MKLYTRTGDDGTTGTLTVRVPKAHPKIETVGALDDLHAQLALVYEVVLATPRLPAAFSAPALRHLEQCMHECLDMGTHVSAVDTYTLAVAHRYLFKNAYLPVDALEKAIDELSDATPPLRRFVLCTGSLLTAHIHGARASARRAERQVALLASPAEARFEGADDVLRFLNRLSDYLFALARMATHVQDGAETPH
jgi:cob(I)alamin adenosyltransferase